MTETNTTSDSNAEVDDGDERENSNSEMSTDNDDNEETDGTNSTNDTTTTAATNPYCCPSPTKRPKHNQQLQQRQRRTVIEDYTKFSKSKLWDLMMRFYDENGISSWSDGIVPHFISSNAFIGKTYAKLLHGFFKDWVILREKKQQLEKKKKEEEDDDHVQSNPATCTCSHHENHEDNNQENDHDDEVFYIIELGGGTGKLAFYILKALEEMKDILAIPFERIVYVLTDFTQSNITFWQQQQQQSQSANNLKPYIDSGRLEFAKFEAENDTELILQPSGTILKKEGNNARNYPICIIANYLIDTLSNDFFQIQNGLLKEGLISIGVNTDEYELKYNENGKVNYNDPQIIDNLMNEFQYKDVDGNSFYEDDDGDRTIPKEDVIHYSQIMSWYQQYYASGGDDKNDGGASFHIPIGFLKAVRHLSDLSCDNAFIIAGDKGSSNPEHFRGLSDPHMALHGSFSLMVNFHAIGLYVQSRGGRIWCGNQEELSLHINCFLLLSDDDDNGDGDNIVGSNESRLLLPSNMDVDSIPTKEEEEKKKKHEDFAFFTHTFENTVNAFSPNDFFVLQKALQAEANPTLLSVVSMMKLSNWDPETFYKFREVILSSLHKCGERLCNDISKGIPKLWDNYYHLGDCNNLGKDIAFELGRVCYGLALHEDALEFYRRSVDLCGDHYITSHNAGLCNFALSKYLEAKHFFEKAIEINPEYEKSKDWLKKVEKEMSK